MTDFEQKRELLARNIDKLKLTAREKQILEYRFSLDRKTVEDTGNKFGVSKQRISQIIKRVFNKIDSLNDNG